MKSESLSPSRQHSSNFLFQSLSHHENDYSLAAHFSQLMTRKCHVLCQIGRYPVHVLFLEAFFEGKIILEGLSRKKFRVTITRKKKHFWMYLHPVPRSFMIDLLGSDALTISHLWCQKT